MTELGTVQNLSGGPVLIDPEGTTLGAGEFGTAAVRTQHVRTLIDAGLVGVVPSASETDSEVDSTYTAAVRATEERRAAQGKADKPAGPAEDRPARPRATSATTAQEG